MPIYEYQCDNCAHHMEALQKISDPLLITCPECGEDALRKRVSAAAFRLKGGGWYETDFKDKKGRKNVAGGGEESSSGGGDKKDSATAKKDDTSKSESKSTETRTSDAKPKSDKIANG